MRYVAFLRNVMVGRDGRSRERLIDAFAIAGAVEPRSILVTGNIVYDLPARDAANFPGHLAAALRATAVSQEDVFVRRLVDLRFLVEQNPFRAAPSDVYERCVTFLPRLRVDLGLLPLRSSRNDAEIFARVGRQVYAVTWRIAGRPGNPGAMIERLARVRVTTRNWNTIERIVARFG